MTLFVRESLVNTSVEKCVGIREKIWLGKHDYYVGVREVGLMQRIKQQPWRGDYWRCTN